jgi:hypothetical protein
MALLRSLQDFQDDAPRIPVVVAVVRCQNAPRPRVWFWLAITPNFVPGVDQKKPKDDATAAGCGGCCQTRIALHRWPLPARPSFSSGHRSLQYSFTVTELIAMFSDPKSGTTPLVFHSSVSSERTYLYAFF